MYRSKAEIIYNIKTLAQRRDYSGAVYWLGVFEGQHGATDLTQNLTKTITKGIYFGGQPDHNEVTKLVQQL